MYGCCTARTRGRSSERSFVSRRLWRASRSRLPAGSAGPARRTGTMLHFRVPPRRGRAARRRHRQGNGRRDLGRERHEPVTATLDGLGAVGDGATRPTSACHVADASAAALLALLLLTRDVPDGLTRDTDSPSGRSDGDLPRGSRPLATCRGGADRDLRAGRDIRGRDPRRRGSGDPRRHDRRRPRPPRRDSWLVGDWTSVGEDLRIKP